MHAGGSGPLAHILISVKGRCEEFGARDLRGMRAASASKCKFTSHPRMQSLQPFLRRQCEPSSIGKKQLTFLACGHKASGL
eukprot:scaffold16162_cov71-Cyclotella_meneghiniana.AAC.14